MLTDINGGFTKLGFVQTTFEEEYKTRPDYITNTLFVAHRQDVPEFKHFWVTAAGAAANLLMFLLSI